MTQIPNERAYKMINTNEEIEKRWFRMLWLANPRSTGTPGPKRNGPGASAQFVFALMKRCMFLRTGNLVSVSYTY